MNKIRIAVIGGTGFENPEILSMQQRIKVDTPYGSPSSEFITGNIGGVEVCILSRHGNNHEYPPSKVNNRANIWAIRKLGCSHIFATTACGSLQDEIGRGHLVFPDQFIDFTRFRANTFFDHFKPGELHHVSMSEPFSAALRKLLSESAEQLNLVYHPGGTVITIEGPRFSTRSESVMFKRWGADIINMSTAPECILANELQIPYAAVAMSTDYDAWKSGENAVTWQEVLEVFKQNVENVIRLIVTAIGEINTILIDKE
jgi:5'-methylthioadenosine phosphorylase